MNFCDAFIIKDLLYPMEKRSQEGIHFNKTELGVAGCIFFPCLTVFLSIDKNGVPNTRNCAYLPQSTSLHVFRVLEQHINLAVDAQSSICTISICSEEVTLRKHRSVSFAYRENNQVCYIWIRLSMYKNSPYKSSGDKSKQYMEASLNKPLQVKRQ